MKQKFGILVLVFLLLEISQLLQKRIAFKACVSLEMGKKDQQRDHKETARVEAVLEIIRKQTPLTVKQVCFVLFFYLSHSTATYYCCLYVEYRKL